MTLASILSGCYERLGYAPSPATAVVTRLTDHANEVHRALLSLPGMEMLRDDTTPVTSVANAPRIGLPLNVARIKRIVDRTNNTLLRETTMTELARRDPGLTSTGNPWAFARSGFQAVQAQPAAATGVWAVSSSASDTSGPTVSLTAIRTGGFLHQPSAQALTGTSRVQVGGQTDYIEIDKFALSAACVGDVSLYDAVTVGNLLAVIPKGQTNARYLGIHWFPVPATALTYYVDYTRTTPDLTTTDEPLLPQDFHDLIGIGIRMKDYEYRGDARFQAAAGEYIARTQQFRDFVQTDGAFLLSLRKKPQRWSQFGGQYPADTVTWSW
jgi:hypothetical protein